MARELSTADVQLHHVKNDLYLIIRGKVYDASLFASEHPGGEELLLDVGGEDATEAYDDAGHSDEANEILDDLFLGTLKAASSDAKAAGVISKTDIITSGEASGKTVSKTVICINELLPEAGTVLRRDTFQDFRLSGITNISPNVAIYRFDLPSPDSVLGLPIGQHISIGADIIQPDGSLKEVVRSYTPITGDDQVGHVDLLIKAYPAGNISRHMAGLALGQTVRMRGPKGAFVYTPNLVRHFGMIAGGTGITPMLQIIKAVIQGRSSGDKTQIDLIFANVTPGDILLKDDIDDLAKEDDGFRVHYVLDKPPLDGWTGGVGYVTAEMIKNWLPKPAEDVKLLLCGPPPMITGLKKITQELGFKKANLVSKLEDQVFTF